MKCDWCGLRIRFWEWRGVLLWKNVLNETVLQNIHGILCTLLNIHVHITMYIYQKIMFNNIYVDFFILFFFKYNLNT